MSPALQVEPGDYDDAQEDPRNRLLDALDGLIEAIQDNGLEFQLRTRLARFLPPPPKAAPVAEAPKADVNAELELSILIHDCKKLESKPMSGTSHKVIERIKQRAEADLQALKQARVA